MLKFVHKQFVAMPLLSSVPELQELVNGFNGEAAGRIFTGKQFYFILQFFLEMP